VEPEDEVEARFEDGKDGTLLSVTVLHLDRASATMFVAAGLYSTAKLKPNSLLTQ